jgi:pimeloyl-ACP methyl ester carboxylesterase
MAKPILRRLRKSALRVLVVYGVVAMILAGCADRLILFPSREQVGVPGGKRVEVPGPQGAVVEVWTMRSAGAMSREPEAFVLEFVGNASRAEWCVPLTAQLCGQRPVEVWTVNYPGYGGSAGGAKLKSIAPAALAAFDALKARAGNRPIFLRGHSIGTTAALSVAAQRQVSGLVLINPPPLRQLILGAYGWWNLWLAAAPVSLSIPDDLDSIKNAGNVKAPALFILGDLDTVVPPAYHMKVVNAFAGEKQVIHLPDGGHNDAVPNGALADQYEKAMDWLWSKATSSSSPH